MSNSNNEVIKKILELIEKGDQEPLEPKTRDVLLFSAVVDIYNQLSCMRAEIQPAITFSRVGLWFASAIGLLVIGFFFALITGRVELIFK